MTEEEHDYSVEWRPDILTRRKGWWAVEFTDLSLDGIGGPLHHVGLVGAFHGYANSRAAAERHARRIIKRIERGLRRR